MSVIVLDAGNSIIKFRSASGKEDEFPHALIEIPEADAHQILLRAAGKIPRHYARVNGKLYAYGPQAEHYGTLTRRYRAERYTRDYYGVITALALSHLFAKG